MRYFIFLRVRTRDIFSLPSHERVSVQPTHGYRPNGCSLSLLVGCPGGGEQKQGAGFAAPVRGHVSGPHASGQGTAGGRWGSRQGARLRLGRQGVEPAWRTGTSRKLPFAAPCQSRAGQEARSRLAGARRAAELDAGVVVLEDRLEAGALAGHPVRAELAEADAVPVSAAEELEALRH